jgi:phage shock protein PspC (stress-responsive transcriptional regulator)
MAEKHEKIDNLLTEFYKKENARPIPSEFQSSLMAKVRSVKPSPVEEWLSDNLWIVLTSIVAAGFIAYIIITKQTFPRVTSQKDLLTALSMQRSIWIQLGFFLATGLCVYLMQALSLRDQADS